MTEHSNAIVPDSPRDQPKPRPMRFRVIGTARHGQVVEIGSQRVTIGSAPNCILRLRAAGVRPLQCLIVREPNAVIIRSLAVDTLLNGEKLNKGLLRQGDHLQVGPIELEVLDDGLGTTSSSDSRESKAGMESQIWDSALQSRPLELLDRLSRLEGELFELRKVNQPVATDNAARVDPQERTDSVLPPTTDDRTVPNDQVDLSLELEQLKAALEQERAQHELTKAEFDVQRSAQSAEIRHLQADVENLTRTSTDAEQTRRGLEQYLADERSRRAELEKQVEEYACQIRQFELQDSAARTEAPSPQANDVFGTDSATSSTDHDNVGVLENRQESQFDPIPDSIPDSQPRREELVRLVQQFAPSEVDRPLDNDRPTAEMPSPVCDLPQSGICDDVTDAACTEPVSPEHHTETDTQTQTQTQTSTVTHESAESATQPLFDVRVPADAQAQLERTEDAAIDAPDESATATATADALSVFDRLSQIGIWKDPDQSPRDEETTSPQTVEPITDQSDSKTEGSSPLAVKDQDYVRSSSGLDDDTIESYMERLLVRVRGDSGPPSVAPASIQAEFAGGPLTESDLGVAEPAEPAEPVLLTASEYQPRSQAPEMNANLAAMRAIANDSRRKNILSHAQRTWTNKFQTKMILSIAGLAVAIGSLFFLDTHSELAFVGLFTGGGIACFWIWQAICYRKRLFDSLRVNAQPSSKVGRDPSGNGSAERR